MPSVEDSSASSVSMLTAEADSSTESALCSTSFLPEASSAEISSSALSVLPDSAVFSASSSISSSLRPFAGSTSSGDTRSICSALPSLSTWTTTGSAMADSSAFSLACSTTFEVRATRTGFAGSISLPSLSKKVMSTAWKP